jgi:anti-sigma factor RsiW
MSDSSECPVDLEEVAEAYVRYTLPEVQAIAFEDHYATCETCAAVLYKTVDYLDAMRAAAKTLRSGPRNDLKMVGRSGNS